MCKSPALLLLILWCLCTYFCGLTRGNHFSCCYCRTARPCLVSVVVGAKHTNTFWTPSAVQPAAQVRKTAVSRSSRRGRRGKPRSGVRAREHQSCPRRQRGEKLKFDLDSDFYVYNTTLSKGRLNTNMNVKRSLRFLLRQKGEGGSLKFGFRFRILLFFGTEI